MNASEIVKEFLVESTENLDALDQAFVALERNPGDSENLGGIFRTIHTIKGTSGFLGYGTLESVAHAGENLLSKLRDGALSFDSVIADALLRVVDVTRGMLESIERGGSDADGDYSDLIAELEALADGERAAHAAAPVTASAPGPVAASVAPVERPAEPELSAVASPTADEPLADDRRTGDDRRAGQERRGTDAAPALAESSLRVDVTVLDRLMNLVGELVLARNQILQFTATQTDTGFIGASQRLNLVTSELQEGVMKTRMQPIGNLWTKFPRIIRDLSAQCGREVRLEMEGKDTELDKTIIEAIKDPLTHIVRNSVDHGIESPADRIARGKSPQGHLMLRAFHEGGQINIEIADDGAGIDADRVRQKAVSRGIMTAEQAARLNDHEAIKLVFLPGFSTAEKVSKISGRGVGMDVVRTNIERIGGTVDIQSRIGQGTTLRIKIPLTLAIIPALIVNAGRERFAIPQAALVELVRLEAAQAKERLEHVGGATFYRLRGNLLPVITLHRELRVEGGNRDGVVSIVVLNADGRQFGLIVDAISDTEEIVVKPLGKQLKRVHVFAGATIMGDGRVALILDVVGLAQQARVITAMRDRSLSGTGGQESELEAKRDGSALLLFQVGEHGRMAVPLANVARLEEFRSSSIEHSGERRVVQYRGDILPLISLARMFNQRETVGQELMQVVVCSADGRSAGLVVDRIVDIVNEPITAKHASARPGVVATAVVQQFVTDLLDVDAVLRTVDEPAPSRAA